MCSIWPSPGWVTWRRLYDVERPETPDDSRNITEDVSRSINRSCQPLDSSAEMRVIHCTLLLLNEILISLQGDFILLVPEEPFVAIAGEDVVLECELLPPTSASNMTVQWLKSGLSSPIHMYRQGQDDPLAQHQDYRGRTELFKDEITEGNISLRLKNVRPDDEGRYTCSVKDRIDFKQATVELRVHSDFILLVPEEPFVAIAGGDVVLECELFPPTSASNMTVQWLKSGLSSPIHVYRHGQDDPLAQHQDYRGRADLFKDEITEGIISLRLKNVRPDDEGQYTCSVEDRTDFKQSTVELHVLSSGSEPRIQMKGYHEAGIQLVCKSSGWNPEPEIQWIGGDGNALTEAETKYHRDSDLVNVESSVRVTRQSSGKLKCIIRSQHLKTEHTAMITISDDLFPAVPEWVLPLVVTICVVIAANSTVIYWNVKQNRRIKELELQKSIIESGQWKPLLQSVWKRIRGHEVSVTLDVETANSELEVSEDRKTVRRTEAQRDLPDTGKRFTKWRCLLGSEGFTSGRHYWEVEVTENRRWRLGVAAESVERKGGVIPRPEIGFWRIGRDDDELKVYTSPESRLPAGPIPGRVGVYLNYESGTVSFYNAETKSHLHTLTGNKFTEKLHPFFWIGYKNEWLRICSGSAPGL
ncbi:butyrophilin subfamily 3 member A1-like isoform X2 [Mobula hypostoma]|uniref:butyrophilin subfamily 3 member A1-like isoform X2 n=1 Tax=Mobula hypostoma TaxID=723540 RepID=UPI002FC36157